MIGVLLFLGCPGLSLGVPLDESIGDGLPSSAPLGGTVYVVFGSGLLEHGIELFDNTPRSGVIAYEATPRPDGSFSLSPADAPFRVSDTFFSDPARLYEGPDGALVLEYVDRDDGPSPVTAATLGFERCDGSGCTMTLYEKIAVGDGTNKVDVTIADADRCERFSDGHCDETREAGHFLKKLPEIVALTRKSSASTYRLIYAPRTRPE